MVKVQQQMNVLWWLSFGTTPFFLAMGLCSNNYAVFGKRYVYVL